MPAASAVRSRVLYDDARELRREILGLLRDGDRDLARDRLVRLRDRTVGLRDDRRASRIGLLANVDVERQAAEERHAVVAAPPLGSARTEAVLGVPARAA